jgi:hypothetical protein
MTVHAFISMIDNACVYDQIGDVCDRVQEHISHHTVGHLSMDVGCKFFAHQPRDMREKTSKTSCREIYGKMRPK